MINLIPNEEKKKKVKDFYFRLLVVIFIMLSFCISALSASLMPAYFLSLVNKNVINEKLETQKRDPVPLIDQGSVAIMENLSNKLQLIDNAEKNKYLVSKKVINEIMLQKMPDIKINQITYDASTTPSKKVSIRGIAPSRERLLLFRQALENDINFKKVDLPISNFVKGSNIEFYLNLIPS